VGSSMGWIGLGREIATFLVGVMLDWLHICNWKQCIVNGST